MTKTKLATKTSFRPLTDRVLLQRLEAEETHGSILLPDSAKKKQETAEVIATGPGKTSTDGSLQVMPVTTGQTVLIEKYSGQDVTIEGTNFVMVHASDIIAIIE